MSLSNDQLLQRIEMIEQKLDEMQVAMNNLASKSQMKALLNIRQSEIEELQAGAPVDSEDLVAIQAALVDIQAALNNVASKAQMKALVNIRQSEIEDLQTRVSTLESKVEILETI